MASASNAIGLALSGGAQAATSFEHYVASERLPAREAHTRTSGTGDLTMTLVDHVPCDGMWYEPIDDVIISIVARSHRSNVVRDIGRGRHSFEESPGCILVTPPNCSSYWHFDRGPLVLHLSVPRIRLEQLVGHNMPNLNAAIADAAQHPLHDPLVSQLGTRLWAMLEDEQQFGQSFTQHALATLLLVLLGGRMRDLPVASRKSCELAPWRLKRVLEAMVARLADGVTVDELASLVGLSPDHFQRCFTATTGRTPYQRLSELRIEQAKMLLSETDRSMTDIALKCGFSSSAHFSTRFKQFEGMSPSTWKATFTS